MPPGSACFRRTDKVDDNASVFWRRILPQNSLIGGRSRRVSTAHEPFRFVGSGLGNLYLVGVEYEVGEDGLQAGAIPCVPELMGAVGRELAVKDTKLKAEEVRFLRKRLRVASKRFAGMVGVGVEQYSRIENGAATITPTVERVVRLLYAVLGPLDLVESIRVSTGVWMEDLLQQERIVARWGKDGQWVVVVRG
jgi:DNA-binding transcriptional regulator YiaG